MRSLPPRAAKVLAFAATLSVLTVAGLVPTPAPGPPKVEEVVLDLTSAPIGVAKQLAFALDAEMVGITWEGDPAAQFEARARTATGWTEWLHLESAGGEQPDGPEATDPTAPQQSAGPAWLGHDFKTVQVRLRSGSARTVKVHALDVDEPAPTANGLFAFGARPAGAAMAPPFIASRAQWGADESMVNSVEGCSAPDYASSVDMAVVHHTVNSNDYGPGDVAGMIRGIFYFHVQSRGWCDIGYNFLVDRFGRIWEGRVGGGHRAVIGGHAGGFNTASTGVSVLGDYSNIAVPQAVYNALRDLLAWKFKFHGVDPLGTNTRVVRESDCNCQRWPVGTVVTLPNIVGHRDVDTTGCPGSLYDILPQLRRDVANLVNSPASVDARLVCDWNGDGTDTPAWYQYGIFVIRQSNNPGPADITVNYGTPYYTPVCGDWNGDGIDTIGVYYNGWWYLRDSNSPGPPNYIVNYGAAGYVPVVGRWANSGLPVLGPKGDGIGVYVNGTWYLRNSLTPGGPDIAPFAFGTAYYRPVTGDWDGDGLDGVGVYANGPWYLRQTPSPGPPQIQVTYGRPTDRPLAGDWDGDGQVSQGVARGSYWYLGKLDGNGFIREFWF